LVRAPDPLCAGVVAADAGDPWSPPLPFNLMVPDCPLPKDLERWQTVDHRKTARHSCLLLGDMLRWPTREGRDRL